MKKILNITNGDCTVDIMQQARLEGEFLPWRDILHEGPVPLNLEFEELCKVRGDFIYQKGWAKKKFIEDDFLKKIDIFQNISKYDKVILWFEHDLYDQLQILQILDLLSKKEIEITMICTDNYLGEQTSDSLLSLQKFEQKVSNEQFDLAIKAWNSFRSESPKNLQELLNEDISSLPFLKESIKRVLHEYPHCDNGLNLTSQLAFKVIDEGETNPWKIFGAYQQSEKSRFMGDTVFWDLLNGYIDTPNPLLATKYNKKLVPPFEKDEVLTLTPLGKEVLKSEKNWLDLTTIDKYIGGVNLKHRDNIWCYNQKDEILKR